MKIAISSTGEDINSPIDPKFGRCPFFIIAEAVIAVNYGPRAFGVLSELGIEMYQGIQGTVEENIQQFIEGKLNKLETATGPMGMGPKPGMGQGQGAGRGMGPGGGQGRRGNM